jgi:hypothetical protein
MIATVIGDLELLPEFLGLNLVLRFYNNILRFSFKLLSCDPYYGRLCITHITPYGYAILLKLKLNVIACTNYFQLICLLKDL